MMPLLLLPGMMCDARLYRHQLDYFCGERAVQCSPIVAYNNMQQLAAEVLWHAPQQFALCGLSMGGIVAMEVYRQAPERVVGLALLDTNPLAELAAIQQRRAVQIDAVRAGGLAKVMQHEMKPHYLTDSANKKAILDLCADMALSLGAEVFERQSQALRDRRDQCDTLQQCQCETLILCGEQDALCPPERHRLMHQLVDHSTLAIIAHAGHLSVLEQPEVCNHYLKQWLMRCDQYAN